MLITLNTNMLFLLQHGCSMLRTVTTSRCTNCSLISTQQIDGKAIDLSELLQTGCVRSIAIVSLEKTRGSHQGFL